MNITYKNMTHKEIQEIPKKLLLEADPSEDSIEFYINKAIGIGAYDKTLMGCCLLFKTKPNTYEIMNVSVDPNYQRSGIGKELVLRAIELCKTLKVQTLEIGTGNSSSHQLRLYQQCGFQIEAVDTGYFVRNYPEAIYENGIQCKDLIRLTMSL